ncbi:MAG TPA: tetratricopeptide repeat protein [Anaeromyxobacteraceae bacterium]|nr:tetratricopeptide repeat protein [Anaeromyxobacteraceae bacterium]
MTKTAHDHLSRKEIKGPDQFQVAASQAVDWMTHRRKQVLLGAGAVVAVLVLGTVFVSMRASQEREAGALLYRAVDAAGGEISSVPLSGVPAPLFKNDEERQRAVIEAAQKVRDRRGGSRAATTATLMIGNAQYRLGDFDKALEAYRAFLAEAPSDDSLRFTALGGIAYALESKGQLDDAAKAWDEAANQSKSFADRAAIEKARVLAKAGKADEARKILGAFPEQHKESPLGAEAAEHLARLGGK